MPNNAKDISISKLAGFDQITAIIRDRPLHDFSQVHSFCYFSRYDDILDQAWRDIELVLAEPEEPHAQIGIKFHRVTDVKFSGFGQIMGLFFQSIQEHGWEQLRFEVGDYEESHIHLFCDEISLFAPSNPPQS